jgi:hypothetical protein
VGVLVRGASGGIGPVSSEGPIPDRAVLELLYELGEIAVAGEDIGERLFGQSWGAPPPPPPRSAGPAGPSEAGVLTVGFAEIIVDG